MQASGDRTSRDGFEAAPDPALFHAASQSAVDRIVAALKSVDLHNLLGPADDKRFLARFRAGVGGDLESGHGPAAGPLAILVSDIDASKAAIAASSLPAEIAGPLGKALDTSRSIAANLETDRNIFKRGAVHTPNLVLPAIPLAVAKLSGQRKWLLEQSIMVGRAEANTIGATLSPVGGNRRMALENFIQLNLLAIVQSLPFAVSHLAHRKDLDENIGFNVFSTLLTSAVAIAAFHPEAVESALAATARTLLASRLGAVDDAIDKTSTALIGRHWGGLDDARMTRAWEALSAAERAEHAPGLVALGKSALQDRDAVNLAKAAYDSPGSLGTALQRFNREQVDSAVKQAVSQMAEAARWDPDFSHHRITPYTSAQLTMLAESFSKVAGLTGRLLGIEEDPQARRSDNVDLRAKLLLTGIFGVAGLAVTAMQYPSIVAMGGNIGDVGAVGWSLVKDAFNPNVSRRGHINKFCSMCGTTVIMLALLGTDWIRKAATGKSLIDDGGKTALALTCLAATFLNLTVTAPLADGLTSVLEKWMGDGGDQVAHDVGEVAVRTMADTLEPPGDRVGHRPSE